MGGYKKIQKNERKKIRLRGNGKPDSFRTLSFEVKKKEKRGMKMKITKQIANIIMAKLHYVTGKLENPIEQMEYAFGKVKDEKLKVDLAVRDCVASLKLMEIELANVGKQRKDCHANAIKIRKVILKIETPTANTDALGESDSNSRNVFFEEQLENFLMEENRMKTHEEQIKNSIAQMRKTVNDLKYNDDVLSIKMQQLKDKRMELKSKYRLADASEKINDALTGIGGGFQNVDSIMECMGEKIEMKMANADATMEMQKMITKNTSETNIVDITLDVPRKISELDNEIKEEGRL